MNLCKFIFKIFIGMYMYVWYVVVYVNVYIVCVCMCEYKIILYCILLVVFNF